MRVSDILQKLPASLEWMVLFNLLPLRTMTTAPLVKAMFFLPDELDLDAYSHVVLSSQGRCLAPQAGPNLIMVEAQAASTGLPATPPSLWSRFQPQLHLFPLDEADCLGLGQTADFPPVLLFAQIRSGYAEAKAIFQQAPNQRHYELLAAVGVQFKGGSYQAGYYLAEFTNRLPTHLHAGLLAHFTRTSHCNKFFLQHGQIDPQLAAGLALAARDRVAWARDCSLEAAAQLGRQASQQPLAMTCQPPPPAAAYPFGDLVPLGFLLKALRCAAASRPAALEAMQAVQGLLLSRRQHHGWAFHTGRLITATDSALVLQGFTEVRANDACFARADFAAAVAALELFADGQGGYYPQLSTEETPPPAAATGPAQPARMVADPANQHWRQPDYATTCLVRGLRQAAGLPVKTSLDYLVNGFETRSGLYFANPYLVDWALATAIQADETAGELRARLLAEILASANDDYTFGCYDLPLSTALAILCLAALGYRGRTLRLAQLRLSDFVAASDLGPATPFYSTFRFDHIRLPAHLMFDLLLNNPQVIGVKGQSHAVSLYQDSCQMITTALAGLALSEKCESASRDPDVKLPAVLGRHPRYSCTRPIEYIAQIALPPYLNEKRI